MEVICGPYEALSPTKNIQGFYFRGLLSTNGEGSTNLMCARPASGLFRLWQDEFHGLA